ncbi:uncharacterized protein A4U43_C07F34470 [Asparagus officinalis]|uniref:Uncharacterized protein n=1 Tax=Asparagus officinalis TaxID=4686 RepID=A0A5P1EH00_ASPOF|nr:uncharacterized protein A4U43_C07F34470 [Asparagus officinalis]
MYQPLVFNKISEKPEAIVGLYADKLELVSQRTYSQNSPGKQAGELEGEALGCGRSSISSQDPINGEQRGGRRSGAGFESMRLRYQDTDWMRRMTTESHRGSPDGGARVTHENGRGSGEGEGEGRLAVLKKAAASFNGDEGP